MRRSTYGEDVWALARNEATVRDSFDSRTVLCLKDVEGCRNVVSLDDEFFGSDS